MADMLKQIREARASSDHLYGPRSVASFEYRRLELSYMLAASLPSSYDSIVNLIESLSETFCGKKNETSEQEKPAKLEILRPVSLKNSHLYTDLFNKNIEKIINSIYLEANPLLQYPYVITKNYSFISSTIPSLPDETILKRSVASGRIVHPVLAVQHDFEVVCAGEYSYLTLRSGENIFICNTCSGHYLPKDIDPGQLLNLLALSLSDTTNLPIILFTSHGWLGNSALKQLIEKKYEN